MIDDQQERDHEQFVEELPDLAAGVLGGRERVALLSHVNSCLSCTDELDQLMAAADSLVHLAPEIDPPIGFESRVMQRIQVRGLNPRRQDRRHSRALAVAAVAAVAIVAFGIGWATHPIGRPPVGNAIIGPGAYSNLAESPLVSGGRSLGTVTVYADEEGWLLMTVESSTWSGPVQCRVIANNGETRTVGSFHLVSGRGAWLAPLPTGVDQIRTAELVGTGGRVLATAQFS
jgi:hypothetical protein